MQTFIKENKVYTSLENLRGWDRNPRTISDEALKRLQEQVERLGQYKPLLVMIDNELGIVLGGNMRLSVYRSINLSEIWVSLIEFREVGTLNKKWKAFIDNIEQNKSFDSKEQAMLEYSLSDNDRVGSYDNDLLSKTIEDFNIDLSAIEYGIDFNEPILLNMPDVDNELQKEPEFKKQYQVVVEVQNEAEQEAVYNKLSKLGLKCKTLTL